MCTSRNEIWLLCFSDDGINYVTSHELNVHRKIKCRVLRAECLHNNSSQREPRLPVSHIVLRLKQVNFKVRLYDLKNGLVLYITSCPSTLQEKLWITKIHCSFLMTLRYQRMLNI